MPTETVTPASSPSPVDQFLTSTLATMKAETTSPAPSTDAKPEPSAHAAPAPAAPSDGAKQPDAPPTVESLHKQMQDIHKALSDQTKANKKLGKNNIELLEKNRQLAKEMQDLKAKYDGTSTAPAEPTPEQKQALVEFQTRESISRKAAEEKYGAEAVQEKIFAEDSPYRQLIAEHPWVHQRVVTSDAPILEAFTVLNEHEVLTTLGNTPTVVMENVEKAVKDKLWKEWTQHANSAPETKPGEPVKTLGDARGDQAATASAKPAPVFDFRSFNKHIP